MSTTTRLTFQDFEKLPEQEGIRYELDQGELVMEASPTFLHNLIRDRIATRLSQFAKEHRPGVIIAEMDSVWHPTPFVTRTSHCSRPNMSLRSI